MDWTSVTTAELFEALREVEWAAPPRPITEFFGRFVPPKTAAKWAAMLKCNLYYYRTNYALMVLISLIVAFLRNPFALVAVLLAILASLCVNNTFAASFSERLLKLARMASPQLAARLRRREAAAPLTQAGGLRGATAAADRAVFVAGVRRAYVVAGLAVLAALLLWATRALPTIAGALAVGLGASIAHASLRSPNLKARLEMGRHEFRAVWRNFRDA